MGESEKKDLQIEVNSEVSKIDPLVAMQQAEKFFSQRLALALKATTNNDWSDQGGNPYLEETGSQKIGARFGICIGNLEIEREDLEDEKGRYYIYTVKGTASWPITGRSIQEIGTRSSRDDFFSHGGKRPIQDIDITDVKKAAVTNFMGRAILKILGLGGLSWDDLSKYSITKKGKASIQYKGAAQKATETKSAEHAQSKSDRPYCTNPFKDQTYIMAYVGSHFSEEFLKNLGLKKSEKKDGLYTCLYSKEIETALEDEYIAAEAVLSSEAKGA